ncbi:hypothetical protein PF008_g20416 [Phytophthora fragariae]|uniref:Uncharacterized protein n=1 Tax=Phytophthora fragariae TaxID=53985 RepID=A0A6G0QZU0_9STRA|nr:hypothetical protein PF008_g20416 [Phytophthora fragariae]
MVAAAGDISTLNIQHGYVEGVVRGFRSGFLTTTTSRNVKLNLQETDYDQFLADEPVEPDAASVVAESVTVDVEAVGTVAVVEAVVEAGSAAAADVEAETALEPTMPVETAASSSFEPAVDAEVEAVMVAVLSAVLSASVASTTNTVVEDFNFLRAQAMEPLGQFLDFITYMYTINNVILLLKDTLRRERAHSFTD